MALLTSVKNAKLLNRYTRPNVGHGLWLTALLPLALLVNAIRHPVGQDYQTITCLAWMILVGQFITLWKHSSNERRTGVHQLIYFVITGTITTLAVGIVIGQNSLLSLVSGLLVTFVVEWTFCCLLHNLPKSFTFGEAAVVAQGFTLFLFNSLAIDFPNALLLENKQPQDGQEIGIRNIIQLGVLLIFILIGFMTALKKRRITKLYIFIPLTTLIVLGIISIPVTQPIPILFVLEFLFSDLDKIIVLVIFVGLLLLTGLICQWQVMRNKPTSTSTRKSFHFVIVIVFLVGLLLQRLVLFLCAGVSFSIFLLLEAIRVGKVEVLAPVLEQTVKSFVDGQDSGLIALTPIYLLVGCAGPLFLSPVAFSGPILPLLSGVLSVGIGDSFASVVGSNFGRHHWQGSNKSIEGAVANALSQLLAIGALIFVGFIPPWTTAIEYTVCLIGVIVNAMIEAKTDQVDNLVVPLVTFIVFSVV